LYLQKLYIIYIKNYILYILYIIILLSYILYIINILYIIYEYLIGKSGCADVRAV
jgi:hypothetical protein